MVQQRQHISSWLFYQISSLFLSIPAFLFKKNQVKMF